MIPDDVIKNMASKMEEPKKENFWEKHSLVFDTSKEISKSERYANVFHLART